MPQILLLVRSAPASPDVADEYNRWYDEVHIPQILERVPGAESAHRYRLTDAQLAPSDTLPAAYLAEYRVTAEDPAAAVAALGAALTDGTLGHEPVDRRRRDPVLPSAPRGGVRRARRGVRPAESG